MQKGAGQLEFEILPPVVVVPRRRRQTRQSIERAMMEHFETILDRLRDEVDEAIDAIREQLVGVDDPDQVDAVIEDFVELELPPLFGEARGNIWFP